MSFNQQIHGIVQRRKLLKDRFLFFVLLTRKSEIVALASNTTIPIINSERFGRITVPLPTLEAQQSILETLEKTIQAVSQSRTLIADSISRLREFRSTLITSAVTGQIDVEEWSRRGGSDEKLDAIAKEMERDS